jgi:hypothetical protein
MIKEMATVRVTEAELARDLHAILAQVQEGVEVIVEQDYRTVAVIKAPAGPGRKISECIALMPADSTATIDPDFAKDVEAAIAAHPEPLESPWD